MSRSRWLPTPAAWRAALHLVRTHRIRLAAGFGLMLLNRLCGLAVPLVARAFTDLVIGQRAFDRLPQLAVAIGLAAVAAAMTTFAVSQVLGVAAAQAVADTRVDALHRIIHWPIGRLERTATGELIARIMVDAEGIRAFVGRDIVVFATSLLTGTATLAVLLVLNVTLTLALSGVIAGFAAVILVASARLRPLFAVRNVVIAATTARLSAALAGIRVVKAFAAEPREDTAFAQSAETLFANIRQTTTGAAAISSLSVAALGLAAVVIMLVGGAQVRDGHVAAGEMATYLSFLALLTLPVAQLAALGAPLAEGFAALDRLQELYALPAHREPAHQANEVAVASRDPFRLAGAITVENVHFAYAPGLDVLKGVSLHAAPGTTTALVGASGAGKTTLVSLIMALFRPTRGRILVDGHDLAEWPARTWLSHVAVVLQDDFIFDGTVAENIGFSRPDADREAILRAAATAHCDEFVNRLPLGYDTLVGERGVRLSGGQRQRLSIARALLADPLVLVLDEATSSLDSEAEAHILDALQTLKRGRTTFVIAHRLSTIVGADQILVIDDGVVVQRGTHHQLLAVPGRYRELHEQQDVS